MNIGETQIEKKKAVFNYALHANEIRMVHTNTSVFLSGLQLVFVA